MSSQGCQIGSQVCAVNRRTELVQMLTVGASVSGNLEVSIGRKKHPPRGFDCRGDFILVILIDQGAPHIVIERGMQGHFCNEHARVPYILQIQNTEQITQTSWVYLKIMVFCKCCLLIWAVRIRRLVKIRRDAGLRFVTAGRGSAEAVINPVQRIEEV